ncbi:unnamed protein product [Notodromas monacha]|uniref:Golgin-84 n=1 Tax=Notodromas monacha TaxID=399045 RepID=A0A7R9GAF8_9CRUS|nr:unnamed protein product [Notodromas monacha]CAG0915295.1 unnamed protein product [Notodromas monacha]
MSWFADLAGKAEEFLNKVDQGAASALKIEGNGLPFTSRSATGDDWPAAKISRKGSIPNLSEPSQALNNELRSGILGRPASAQHKKTFSNASAPAAAHSDDALIEFLNAPVQQKSRDAPSKPEVIAKDEEPSSIESDCKEEPGDEGKGESEVPEIPSGLDVDSENSLLRNEILNMNREMSQLFGRIKSHEKETKMLRKDLEREKESTRQLSSRIRDLQERENDMRQMLEAKDSQVSVLKVRLEEAEEKFQNAETCLRQTVLDHEKLINASSESIAFQNNALESLRKQLEETEAALANERDSSRFQNQENMEKLSMLEQTQSTLAASFAEAENRAEIQAQIAEKRRKDILVIESRVQQAQQELADYKQKAQRILSSKDTLIATLKSNRQSSESVDTSDSLEMEQLRQERDLLQEEVSKQRTALDQLKVQMNELETGHQNALAGAQDQLRYQNELLEEERLRTRELQNQCSNLNDELVFLREDLTQQKFNFAAKIQDRDMEIEKMRKQLMAKKTSSASQVEMDNRLQALTQNLIQKQTQIEQLTTDKSTLIHQVERLERRRQDTVYRGNGGHGQDTYLLMNSTDDGMEETIMNSAKAHIPSFMVESPFDGKMTRRVKRVYSTLDTFSVRLGVFLRRFPIARIMVLAYMGLLHLWVMIVLLTYQPEIHFDERPSTDDPDSGINVSTPSELVTAMSNMQMTSTPIKAHSLISHENRVKSSSTKRSLSAIEIQTPSSRSTFEEVPPASLDSSVLTVIRNSKAEGLLKNIEKSLDAQLGDGATKPATKRVISKFLMELSHLIPDENYRLESTLSDMDITIDSLKESKEPDYEVTPRQSLSTASAIYGSDSLCFCRQRPDETSMRTPQQRTETTIDDFLSPLIDSSALDMTRGARRNYADWIAKILDVQLANLKLKLESQFREELGKLRSDKNREIQEISENYERQLSIVRETACDLEKQLKRAARDFIQMNEVKSRQIKELKGLLESEQEKQRNCPTRDDIELAIESERLALQQRHTEKLTSIIEKTRAMIFEIHEQHQNAVSRISQELVQVTRERDLLREELVDSKTRMSHLERNMRRCRQCANVLGLNDELTHSSNGNQEAVSRNSSSGLVDTVSNGGTTYLSARSGSVTSSDGMNVSNRETRNVLDVLGAMRSSLPIFDLPKSRSETVSKNSSVNDESLENNSVRAKSLALSPMDLAQVSAKLRKQLKNLEASLNKKDEEDRRSVSNS